MKNQKDKLKLPQPPKIHPQNNDSLFKKIYSDKKELVSLCKGLTGIDNITEDDIQVTTLQENNAIYVQIRNDLSFIIGSCIYLCEQQTAPNPNMPVRQGSYYFNTLSELCGNSVFHSTALQKIPQPILITFTNGDPKEKPREILKLSDMFFKSKPTNDEHGKILVDGISRNYIEVYVEVIYLNNPNNTEFLNKIPSLKGFAVFTKAIKDFVSQGYTKAEAVERAIEYTLQQKLLVDLLLKEREGVKSMVMSQITQEEWDTFKFEEGRAEGKAEGKIELLYTELNYTADKIATKLNLPLKEVQQIIKKLGL
ncbi:MAG: hypothetical protein ATN34_01750 [Epulopiscium sp. Nele67-Bin002]|nr:MAG: hypothetical protein ATN34_01750 [Epulopiscium sp. Nele67-Bin002]